MMSDQICCGICTLTVFATFSMYSDSDSDTEKVVVDEESSIEMVSLENGRNDHTFSFGKGDRGGYDNNVNEWHCYIFEFANADRLVTDKQLWRDYTFKITAVLQNFELENGYDFVRVFVNSKYEEVFR